jgi:hypothetical protein
VCCRETSAVRQLKLLDKAAQRPNKAGSRRPHGPERVRRRDSESEPQAGRLGLAATVGLSAAADSPMAKLWAGGGRESLTVDVDGGRTEPDSPHPYVPHSG